MVGGHQGISVLAKIAVLGWSAVVGVFCPKYTDHRRPPPTTTNHRGQTTNLLFHSHFVLIRGELAWAMLREGRKWSGDGTGFIWGHI